MENKYRFSIIVPVYNVEKYLNDCVESVLGQGFQNFEIILVDDGSPDNCPQMCDELAKMDERIKVIHKTNGGLSDARNTGLSAVSGEYIIFIDSDDKMSYPDALMDIDKCISENPCVDMVITKTWRNVLEHTVRGEQLLEQLLANGLRGDMFRVTVWDKVYKKDFIVENKFFFQKGYVHEDLLWTLTAIAKSQKCVVLEKDFYERNENDQSITRSISEKSVYNRAFSKLNIAKIGCNTFEKGNFSKTLVALVYEFYIGVYINGLVEGNKLTAPEFVSKFREEIKKTSSIIRYGIKTKRHLYKIMSILYIVFGYKILYYLKIKR